MLDSANTKGKKDTPAADKKQLKEKADKWADTSDSFVNLIYKKLKNKNKKLDKIKETEDKITKKEITPNQEQLEKIQNKQQLTDEMKELEGTLKMYK